jgi:hypothetical protein
VFTLFLLFTEWRAGFRTRPSCFHSNQACLTALRYPHVALRLARSDIRGSCGSSDRGVDINSCKIKSRFQFCLLMHQPAVAVNFFPMRQQKVVNSYLRLLQSSPETTLSTLAAIFLSCNSSSRRRVSKNICFCPARRPSPNTRQDERRVRLSLGGFLPRRPHGA